MQPESPTLRPGGLRNTRSDRRFDRHLGQSRQLLIQQQDLVIQGRELLCPVRRRCKWGFASLPVFPDKRLRPVVIDDLWVEQQSEFRLPELRIELASNEVKDRRQHEEAFNACFRLLWRPVSAYLVNRVGAADADDVAQEVFSVVYRRWPLPIDDPDHLKAWVLSVARSKAKDHLRSRSRRRQLVQRHEQPFPDADPAETVTALDLAQRLAIQAGATGKHDAHLLLLLAEQRTTREIAEELQISITAATTRIHRLRKRLGLSQVTMPTSDGDANV